MKQLIQIFLVLRARRRVAIAVALITFAVLVIGRELVPARYAAETTVMVDIRNPDPIASVLFPAMAIQGNMSAQTEIIKSNRVARKVAKFLQLEEKPEMIQRWQEAGDDRGQLADWLSNSLQKGLTVTPSPGGNTINILYSAGNPAYAAAVANAYAQAYIDTSVELKVEPAREYARWFGTQAKLLRENLEKAQARLSEFQERNGMVATEGTVDFELAKLNDLSARLTAVQGETRDAQSKQRSEATGEDLPEIQQNTVVAGLRSSIAQFEAKLKEAAGNLGVAHPQYKRMEAELAELRSRLDAEMRHVAGGYRASGAVGKARERELEAAIKAQKRKLQLLKKGQDEAAVLVRDVESAKKAYEAVTNRYNQTSLESQATQTNISVLVPAVERPEPSFPKSRGKTALMALILGILLAGASVIGLEALDRRVRSEEELSEMLQLPVLAVVEGRRQPHRLALPSRVVGPANG